MDAGNNNKVNLKSVIASERTWTKRDYISYDSINGIFSKRCFPGSSVVKNLPTNAGDTEDEGSNPGQEGLLK